MVKCLTRILSLIIGIGILGGPAFAESARVDRVPGHRAAQKDAMSVTPSDASSSKRDESVGTYEDCVKNWDRGLHMTKQEWRVVCRRTHPKG
jgi:hypothetical protein